MKYRKKPVIIEAIQWTGGNFEELDDFVKDGLEYYIHFRERGNKTQTTMIIKTLEGEHIASKGDYIIKGVKGEFYPCKPDIFKQTYEEVVK